MDSSKSSAIGKEVYSKNMQIRIRYWLFGGVAAMAFLWLVNFLFVDSIVPWAWDPVVHDYTIPPGTYRMRSEGNGTTHIQDHGIIGNISEKTNKIVIWGDSYVEALQVSDKHKMSAQLSGLLSSHGNEAWESVAVARSGRMVADYYFNIPNYEKILSNIRYHVIVVASVKDFLPDEGPSGYNRFISEPELAFVPAQPPQETEQKKRFLEIKTFLNHWQLQFIWNLYRDFFIDDKGHKAIVKELRFTLGETTKKQKATNIQTTPNEKQTEDVFAFAVGKLKEATEKPIIIVYCPLVPRISNGAIDYTDPNQAQADILEKACRAKGIKFVNMNRAFEGFFRKSNRFPRGFANTSPGDGHFNDAGHRLVANSIYDLIKAEDYAFYSN